MIEIVNFDDDDPPVFAVRITGERSADGLDAWLGSELPTYVHGKAHAPWVQVVADEDGAIDYDSAARLAHGHGLVLSVRVEGTGTATFAPEQ